MIGNIKSVKKINNRKERTNTIKDELNNHELMFYLNE